MIGHTLSAAGAVEAVFTLLTLAAPAHPADHQLQRARPGDSARRGAEHGARRQGAPRDLEFVRLRRPERLAGDGARAGVTHARAHPGRRPQARAGRRRRRRRRPAPARCRSASRRSRSTTSTSGAFAAWPSPSASCRWWSARRRPARSPPSAPDVAGFKPGDPVVMYGALTCGTCKACREGRDNLCENVGGIMGFHVDGFARDLVNMPARLVIPVPDGVALRDAACAPIAFATVSTCCSTMPSSSRARPCWCMPAAPASAPSRSRWPRRSAAR